MEMPEKLQVYMIKKSIIYCHFTDVGKWGLHGGELSEGGRDATVITYEMSIKIGKPKKTLELFAGGGRGPFSNCLHLQRVCLNLPLLYDKAQKNAMSA